MHFESATGELLGPYDELDPPELPEPELPRPRAPIGVEIVHVSEVFAQFGRRALGSWVRAGSATHDTQPTAEPSDHHGLADPVPVRETIDESLGAIYARPESFEMVSRCSAAISTVA
jgi:hypothetical protein